MRVRFAPSPTGNLHIGTVRTALFNCLYARHHGGTVVLRVEDTDLERSKPDFEINILEGLKWLGLEMDEGPGTESHYGPYRQSERLEAGIYKEPVQKLIDDGNAYYCFCTPEELDAERDEAKAKNIPYVYSRKALELSPEEVSEKLEAGVPYTIRFKMPDQKSMVMTDLIRDDIDFDLSLISDFVIMKSDGYPSYNFAVVVDDIGMGITHVIRGEDHISNTPKQMAIFQALGAEIPQFAHLPMILGQDKSKLSKRHGSTSVTEYQEQGFLPEAMFNYLSLLGWSPKDETEILSKEEIISQFDFDRVSKSNAVFDLTKLKWMNGQYIRSLDASTLLERVRPYLSEDNASALAKFDTATQEKMVVAIQDNLEVLSDIDSYIEVFLESDDTYQNNLKDFEFSDSDGGVWRALYDKVKDVSSLTVAEAEQVIDSILEETGLGKGKVFKPIRFGLTAKKSGPNIPDILSVFAGEKLNARLENLIQ